MTIPSVTASIPAPVAAPKGGVPAAQTAATADVSSTSDPAPVQPSVPLDALLAAVKQSAAARQDGLAVLMANALQAASATLLPDPVQTAVDQLLALHLSTDQAPDAAAVKTALQTSGLFTEANLASATTRLPVDVKTALLQLNQAAEAWLVRAVIASDPKLENAGQPAAPSPTERSVGSAAKTTPADSKPAATPNAAPAVRPNSQTPSTPGVAQARAPDAATAMTTPAVSVQLPAPPATAPASAAAAKPIPETPMPASAPVPDAFKPVLQLLTQAVEVLEAPQQQAAANSPVAPSQPTAAPARPMPTAAVSAPPRTSVPIKAAMALLSQALENWPSQEPPPASSEPFALNVSPKIAAQTFASTAPAPEELDTTAPPEIKAVLVVLGKAIQPWLERATDNANAPANTSAPAKPPAVSPSGTTTASTASTTAKTDGTAANRSTSVPDTTSTKTPTPAASISTSSTVPAKTFAPTGPAGAPDLSKAAMPAQPQAPAATSATPSPSPLPSPSQAAATPNDLRALLSLLSKAVENWQPPAPETASNAADARPAQPSVPPPTPGLPGKAQGPAAPTLPEKADVALIAKTLVVGSDAALARQTLLQIASLPDSAAQTRNNQARWMFDLPVMTPQGPAVAQIAIERDGRNATAEQPKPVWRVQFTIDIAPLGPVRATMALSGGQAWVMVHADQDDAVEKLRGQMSWLAGALQETDLEANIAVEPSHTTQPARRGRPLVDRAS